MAIDMMTVSAIIMDLSRLLHASLPPQEVFLSCEDGLLFKAFKRLQLPVWICHIILSAEEGLSTPRDEFLPVSFQFACRSCFPPQLGIVTLQSLPRDLITRITDADSGSTVSRAHLLFFVHEEIDETDTVRINHHVC
jgi:hypothetical protein